MSNFRWKEVNKICFQYSISYLISTWKNSNTAAMMSSIKDGCSSSSSISVSSRKKIDALV